MVKICALPPVLPAWSRPTRTILDPSSLAQGTVQPSRKFQKLCMSHRSALSRTVRQAASTDLRNLHM